MSKAKSTGVFKVLFFVGLFGLVGIGGVAGLAYAGWRLVTAPSADGAGAEAGDARNTESKNPPGGIVGWLRSADEKLAVLIWKLFWLLECPGLCHVLVHRRERGLMIPQRGACRPDGLISATFD